MQGTGIWNHWQPVTIALVDPDFDSQLKAWVTLLGYKPYHYAVIEAPYPSKAACTSMWSTYKVYEPIHMQWMGIWNQSENYDISKKANCKLGLLLYLLFLFSIDFIHKIICVTDTEEELHTNQ